MATALDMRSEDFERRFVALLAAKRKSSADVDAVVAAIIEDVRARGDEALADLSLRFDRVDLTKLGLKIGAAEVDAAIAACDHVALKASSSRTTGSWTITGGRSLPMSACSSALGVELGWRWRPTAAVGLYVPGGAAELSVFGHHERRARQGRRMRQGGDGGTPTPDGRVNPLVLAAARIGGVHEIYRVGGAQAIAALAFGTGRSPRSPRSSDPATPMLQRPSVACLAWSAST